MVNFKPINKNDITKRLRIFASNISILPNAQIEICIENLGDLPIDLSMEVFCWDRELDETQSVGNIMFKLKPNETKNLASFKMDDVRVKCGNWKMDGIDFRVHFKRISKWLEKLVDISRTLILKFAICLKKHDKINKSFLKFSV